MKKIVLAARRLRSLLSACGFAQAIGDGSVFTDVSVVVEGDQGEISNSALHFNLPMSPTGKMLDR